MNGYPVPHGYLPSGEKLEVSFKEFQRLFKEGKVIKSVGVHLAPTFNIIENKYEVGETVTIGPAYAGPDGKEDYKHTRHEEYYLNMVKPFFPNLKLEDIGLHQVGLRARLKDYYDFVIEKDSKFPNCVNIIGIDSPGLTASLAIAKYVKELIEDNKN
ncbi:unnamed protein product [marine sediment metagenome]|uniref:FAD dependent oxidoreductase domain-containing protein n=1 Tax=marine sediment metagenome TaxID=412755 RepID=X0ZJT1_9ZZZZ